MTGQRVERMKKYQVQRIPVRSVRADRDRRCSCRVFYATVVRPRADAIIAHDAAMMAKDPNYVPTRSIYIIIKDYEQEVCFMLALWAAPSWATKAVTLRRGRDLLGRDLLRLPEGMKILPEDSRDYARQVEALPDNLRSELMPRALLSGLHRFGSTRNIQDVSSAIHDVCQLEFDRLDSELSMVRYVAWAIPAIGFIGTVRGIGEALQQAHKAVEGDVSGVVAGLGIAFNSTLVALAPEHRDHVHAAPDPAAAGARGARHRGIPRPARDPADARPVTSAASMTTTLALELNDAGLQLARATAVGRSRIGRRGKPGRRGTARRARHAGRGGCAAATHGAAACAEPVLARTRARAPALAVARASRRRLTSRMRISSIAGRGAARCQMRRCSSRCRRVIRASNSACWSALRTRPA